MPPTANAPIASAAAATPSRGPAATSSAARQSANAGHEAARLRVPKRFEPTALTIASPTGTDDGEHDHEHHPAVRRLEAPADCRGEQRPRAPTRERERERDERRHPGQLAYARARREVGEADRPVDDARAHERRAERLEDREDVGRRRVQVHLESGEPRHERDRGDGRGDERASPRLGVRPQRPREQSREREHAGVVRVDRGARTGGVARPPAGAAAARPPSAAQSVAPSTSAIISA